ncbi:hypothetical protein GCM10010415_04710 [Streptomyces atrovirens]
MEGDGGTIATDRSRCGDSGRASGSVGAGVGLGDDEAGEDAEADNSTARECRPRPGSDLRVPRAPGTGDVEEGHGTADRADDFARCRRADPAFRLTVAASAPGSAGCPSPAFAGTAERCARSARGVARQAIDCEGLCDGDVPPGAEGFADPVAASRERFRAKTTRRRTANRATPASAEADR